LKKTLVYLLFPAFCCICPALHGQENEPVQTIKVKKDKLFSRAAFDESEYKVIAFDKYGNPHEKAIKSFSIFYKEGKTAYEAPVEGNTFPDKTIKFLTKKKSTATKICLTKLVAVDENGHEESLPDLCDIVIFPDCKKVNKKG
jgi:hypothetical protein